MTTTLSLSGKKTYNALALTGKPFSSNPTISTEIKKIKILFFNRLIIPLLSKQWKILYENLFCLDKVKNKLVYYYKNYKLDDLIMYIELIKAIELILSEHKELEELEKKVYASTSESSNISFSTMIYKTSMIKLKPEYEIYNLILGPPNMKLQEKYNEEIIKHIEKLLLVDNITFNNIKNVIITKYCN